ncbi:abortive infection family protein [Chitinophaga vietnamensis]|uniref:abortive infection family protein n=1 Tax=Chitinophaga vietnamensis TaxID=2593957 RepID=UPI00117802D9|nr:abortive infection family protein [Chitinophaga vietnamensis]
MRGGIVQDIDAIKATTDDRDFVALEKTIHDSIKKNEPEHALDRLHTFMIRYIRELCQKHNISFTNSESLNAIYGKYVTHLVKNKLIESAMTEKILRYATNLLDAFNDIRNNRSLAHDNQLLNYDESLLIVNTIANAIKFIQKIEGNLSKSVVDTKDVGDSLPF